MIHEALRLLRVYHNQKQKDVAEELGISNSFLCEIESGKKTPSLELLEAYSRLFDIPVSSIMIFAEQKGKANATAAGTFIAKKVLGMLDWLEMTTRPSKR